MSNLTFTNTSKILSMVNSKVTIFNLTATGGTGGNVFFFEECKVDINLLHIKFNFSQTSLQKRSAAIYTDETSFNLTNSSFSGAKGVHGGAVYIGNSKPRLSYRISNTSFTNCTAH